MFAKYGRKKSLSGKIHGGVDCVFPEQLAANVSIQVLLQELVAIEPCGIERQLREIASGRRFAVPEEAVCQILAHEVAERVLPVIEIAVEAIEVRLLAPDVLFEAHDGVAEHFAPSADGEIIDFTNRQNARASCRVELLQKIVAER